MEKNSFLNTLKSSISGIQTPRKLTNASLVQPQKKISSVAGEMTTYRPPVQSTPKDTFIKNVASSTNTSATNTATPPITPSQNTNINQSTTPFPTQSTETPYSKSMQEYVDAKKKYLDFENQYRTAQNVAQDRVQPMSAIAGEQASLERKYGAQAQRLSSDVTSSLENVKLNKPELPASAQEYEYAKAQGYKGTFSQYQNEDANRKARASGTGSTGSDLNALLSVSEAKALGVPYGTTRGQAVGIRSLSSTEKELQNDANSALLSLKTIENKIKNPDGTYATRKLINLGWNEIGFAERELKDVISRVRSGAALTPGEMAFYKKQVPRPIDTDATARLKFNQLAAFYSGLSGNPVTLELPDGTTVVADDMYDQTTREDVRKAITNGANIISY